MTKVRCDYCNKEFNKVPSKIIGHEYHFCCNECFRKYQKEYPSKVELTCIVCGKKFTVNKYRAYKENAKYCSQKCFYKSLKKHNDLVEILYIPTNYKFKIPEKCANVLLQNLSNDCKIF